ncbi:ATP-binding protein [Streptomyces sp. GS7]|uniref:ATP-binding protein n=1 Tax=Streptomyces sp. GS7 TaxID=2692234 RepID=UPI001319B481|nr:tetratricopeptide repeat protein [Streptomyces sp. GS7]QHC23595.1 tetratricopeptide repeat protein [Streptomyces sp. GS7]
MPERFDTVLRAYRRRAGLTQEELSERAGLSARTIRALESGQGRVPRMASVREVAKALGLGADDQRRLLAAADEREGAAGSVSLGRRRYLPYDIPDFTGRTAEVARLAELVGGGTASAVVVSAIDGMAGVGKTTLAVHAAHLLADGFPDGQFYCDLHGFTPGYDPVGPASALEALLRMAGVDGARIPHTLEERSALWRTTLSDWRALMVLDNAADAAQVRPLLPGSASCAVLVTSRRRLLALEGAVPLSLGVLSEAEACALVARIAGHDRVADAPEAVAEIAELCGYLPLAIRMAAARLAHRPAWTAEDLTAELRRGRRRSGPGGNDQAVSAAFALSYARLSPGRQRLFRLLGLHPGADLDAYAAAALAGTDAVTARQWLEELVDVHLLEQYEPHRYQLHDLLRRHTQEVLHETEPPAQREEAELRLLDHYLHTALHARPLVAPGQRLLPFEVARPPADTPDVSDRASALAWYEAEHANLVAMITHAAARGRNEHVWQYTHLLQHFFDIRGRTLDWVSTHELALATTGDLDNRLAHAEILTSLGVACWHAGRYEDAFNRGLEALALCREIGDAWGEAVILTNFGIVQGQLGQSEEAIDLHQQALALYGGVDAPWGEALSLTSLGTVYARLGRAAEALDHHRRALDRYRGIGDPWGEALTLTNMGTGYRQLGQFGEAVDHHAQALSLSRRMGDRRAESEILNDLGATYHAAGRRDAARRRHLRALDIARAIDSSPQIARAHQGIAYTLAPDDPDSARDHAERALAIHGELSAPETAELTAFLDALGQGPAAGH